MLFNFFNKLTFKIVFPIFAAMTILGVVIYVLILNTVTDFSRQSIKKDLNFASRSLYNVVDDGFTKLLQSGKSKDNISMRIQKSDTIGKIEDFVRDSDFKVILFVNDKKYSLFNNTPYNVEQIRKLSLGENKISLLEFESVKYFGWYFKFEPWDWNIVLIRDVREYSALIQKVQTVYLATAIVVFFIFLLLIYYLHKTIKVPISELIAPMSMKIHPNYKGVYEFEFLSDRITDMMKVIQKNEDIQKRKADELEKTIHHLKITQTQLIESEKMAALGSLVAGVAHEINTPVGIGITGMSHFLDITENISENYKNDNVSKIEFEEYLKTSLELAVMINNNLHRTAQLIKSFKQISVDQISEEKRKFNLKDYITEVLFSISTITKKTNLTIDVSCEDNLIFNSYPGAFSQVITNLIINSVRHAYKEKEVGRITIDVSKVKDMIQIIYKDDGRGIAKENLGKIFDPFFTTNRTAGGTGLGLNIIRNIVNNNLKGSIVCNSVENHGVEFIIKMRES